MDHEAREAEGYVRLEAGLSSLGLALEPPGADTEGLSLASSWRLERLGRKDLGAVALRAAVFSWSWRIDVRRPGLLVQLDGVDLPGRAIVHPGERDIGLFNLLSHFSANPRQHTGDAAFDASFGVHAHSADEALGVLTPAIRQALLDRGAIKGTIVFEPRRIGVVSSLEVDWASSLEEALPSFVGLAEALAGALR